MRIGIIGGGTIARLFLDHIARGDLADASVVAILGRETSERSRALALEHGVAFTTTIDALLAAKPEVIVEAAGHEALRSHAERVLHEGPTFHESLLVVPRLEDASAAVRL